jgi:hypothetical protein
MEVSGQLHVLMLLGWVGPRAGLGAVAKRKTTSLPLAGIDARSSSP